MMRDRGFTLVELLISIVIGIIIVGAGFGVYITFSKSFSVQTSITEMQENARIGMNIISSEIKFAGYGMGCGRLRSYYDPGTGQQAGDDTFFLAPVKVIDSDPDTIIIFYGSGEESATIREPMPNSSAVLKVYSIPDLEVGDLMIITDGCEGTILQVSGFNEQSRIIQHNPGGNFPYNPPGGHNIFPEDGYDEGDKVILLRNVSFYIDRDSDPPVLYRDPDGYIGNREPEAIALGIEYIDFELAGDFDGDSIIDDSNSDGDPDWWTPTQVEVQDKWDNVRAVKIHLVARTVKEDRSFRPNGDNPLTPENEADGYRRIHLVSVVYLRNFQRYLE
jgi:type IV pilus assembly protein PilW